VRCSWPTQPLQKEGKEGIVMVWGWYDGWMDYWVFVGGLLFLFAVDPKRIMLLYNDVKNQPS
jgi:hypothetical protein